MFTTIALAIFGAIIMIIISSLLIGGITFGLAGLGIIMLNLIVGSIFWGAFLLALAAISKSNQMYNSLQVIILFFASFASTVFYPISGSTPAALRYTVALNPLTYIADTVRDGYISLFNGSLIVDELILLFATIVMFMIALLSYRTIKIGVK
jgi:ABC-2 type transport system permease protein